MDATFFPEIRFLVIENLFSALKHQLVVRERLLTAFSGEKIERGASNGVSLRRCAKHLEVGFVIQDILRLRVLHIQPAWQVIDDRAEEISFLDEPVLRFLRVSDVAGNAERADDVSLRI